MGTATGRNKKGHERDPHDYYPTPPWCTHRLLDAISLDSNGLWFEPASGNGALVRAANEWFETKGEETPKWITNDIRSDAEADFYKNFAQASTLKFYQNYDIDVFITNPPFALADRFLEQALKLHNSEGKPPIIVMLLRLQWMATKGRSAMMKKHTPTLAILPDRPNFTVTGNGDMCEYAWHIWEHPDTQADVIVLDTTEARQRKGLSANVYSPLFKQPEKHKTLF